MARSRSIGTKLTPDEERQILAAAEAEGEAPSKWARDLLLREVQHVPTVNGDDSRVSRCAFA